MRSTEEDDRKLKKILRIDTEHREQPLRKLNLNKINGMKKSSSYHR